MSTHSASGSRARAPGNNGARRQPTWLDTSKQKALTPAQLHREWARLTTKYQAMSHDGSVAGIIPGEGRYELRPSASGRRGQYDVYRVSPATRRQVASARPATREELDRIDAAMRMGAFQIEWLPHGGLVRGQGGHGTQAESAFQRHVLYRATGRTAPLEKENAPAKPTRRSTSARGAKAAKPPATESTPAPRTRAPSATARVTALRQEERRLDAEVTRAANAPKDPMDFHRTYVAWQTARREYEAALAALTPAQRARAEAAIARAEGRATATPRRSRATQGTKKSA